MYASTSIPFLPSLPPSFLHSFFVLYSFRETEEQALRWLLEDGKLNLCLRCLIEFKSSQIKTRKMGKGPMVSQEFIVTSAAGLCLCCSPPPPVAVVISHRI